MLASSGLPGLETIAAALPFADGVLSVAMVKFELYRNRQKIFISRAGGEAQVTSEKCKQQELAIPFRT